MPEWPDTLPQVWLQEGYQETLPNVMVRTEMDAGPAKSRRRFTCQVTPIKSQMIVTEAQKVIIEGFYNDNLAGGCLSFTFPHSGADVLRFIKPPEMSKAAGLMWRAHFELEKLP